jgi:hypothetical protein
MSGVCDFLCSWFLPRKSVLAAWLVSAKGQRASKTIWMYVQVHFRIIIGCSLLVWASVGV